MGGTRCEVGADAFIERFFQDCIYSNRDLLGFILGLASIATWMVAQIPQILRNMKNQSAEALSAWFLAEWLLGDTCNLIGCLMTGSQLVTQTYTAMYFICADICLVVQYIYYGTLQRRRARWELQRRRQRSLVRTQAAEEGRMGHSGPSEIDDAPRYPVISPLGRSTKPRVLACIALLLVWQQGRLRAQHSGLHDEGDVGGGMVLKARQLLWGASSLDLLASKHKWTQWTGQMIGYLSSVLYLGSRSAQIYKNWSRHSAEGLSLAMFGCAIFANCLYGGGILIRTYSLADLTASTPWILGSLGTVALDLTIFAQYSHYASKGKIREEEALLDDTSHD